MRDIGSEEFQIFTVGISIDRVIAYDAELVCSKETTTPSSPQDHLS